MRRVDRELDEGREEHDRQRTRPASWFLVPAGLMVVVVLVAMIALPYILDRFTPAPGNPPAVVREEPAPPVPPPPARSDRTRGSLRELLESAPSPRPPSARAPASPPSTSIAPPREAEKPRAEVGAPVVKRDSATKVAPPAPKRMTRQPDREEQASSRAARAGYLVQVGAFEDAAKAGRLAAQLTGQKYPVQRATVSRPGSGGSGHEILIVGASVDEVSGRLRGTSQRAVATSQGVLIQPALPLKEAVNLSQELRADGLSVRIRRAQGTATLHIVRVGAYANRSQAEAVRKELDGKGVPGFIVHVQRGER